jgi:hypothetical protein
MRDARGTGAFVDGKVPQGPTISSLIRGMAKGGGAAADELFSTLY